MDAAKSYLKSHDVVERISFKDKSPHTVELGKDKEDTIKDQEGKELEGVRFLVKENGEAKSFFTTSISLIQKLASKEAGDSVTIQMKSRKGDDGQYRSYYEVSEGTTRGSEGVSEGDDDPIPTINEEDGFDYSN